MPHAHQKEIIHRDIKPSNILVTLHDGMPVPEVIDFGIAKATEGRLTDATVYTQLQQFVGTPAYMSPEQAEMSGLGIDTRSDIYSLGVVICEMLTGELPLGRFPAPSQRTSVDARIDEIVFKTLEEECNLRQQSATEVKTQISQAYQSRHVPDRAPAVPKEAEGASAMARVALGLMLGGVIGLPPQVVFGVQFQSSLGIPADPPANAATGMRAAELDDLLVCGIEEDRRFTACADQGQRAALRAFQKRRQSQCQRAAGLRAFAEDRV